MQSVVLILPASQRATGDLVSIALGHDVPPGQTYVVALSPTGDEPATHYGCHTWTTDAFVAAITACKAQTALPPANWGAVGLTGDDVFSMCSDLIMGVAPSDANPKSHFTATLTENGLQRIA